MIDPARILFIHGSDSSSQTYKASILRGIFPGMLTPDFNGDLPERMKQLEAILGTETGWTLVGSSLGGLMAALFAMQHPGSGAQTGVTCPGADTARIYHEPCLPNLHPDDHHPGYAG